MGESGWLVHFFEFGVVIGCDVSGWIDGETSRVEDGLQEEFIFQMHVYVNDTICVDGW